MKLLNRLRCLLFSRRSPPAIRPTVPRQRFQQVTCKFFSRQAEAAPAPEPTLTHEQWSAYYAELREAYFGKSPRK